MLYTRRAAIGAAILSLSLLAAACGDDDDAGATDTTEAGSDTTAGGGAVVDIEGDVVVSGSSTVEPISSAVGESLEDLGSGIAATVDGPGTGDGFQLFCAGETDISDASRPIDEEEAAACEEAGVEFVELKVAFDGISVVTSPENEAVECLNFADLYALTGPESEGFDNWTDAQALAAELGSDTTFPDAELVITAPGEESGTYDSFLEISQGDIGEARAEAGQITEDQVETSRKDYSSQADDSQIIAGVEGSPTSLGWVGFAFAQNEADAIRSIAVAAEPGGDCVEPTTETIADGSYPLSRPLYIYVSVAAAEENPAVAGYVDHYLGEGYAAVEEVGYVSLPDDQLAETVARWEERTTGTAEG